MLKVKRGHRVDKLEGNFWVEPDVQGHYTDIGSAEEREVLEDLKQKRWEDVVAAHFGEKHPWLYSIITDSGRALFLDLLPLREAGRYLDVGSGWGQVAIPLAQHGDVFCLDISIPRLKIVQEIARQEEIGLNYVCGNFLSFPFEDSQFDAVIFNGALEWIALGLPGETIWQAQQRALKQTHDILVPGGSVYIGIENALGLKYLLGAPEDHTCQPYFSFLSEEKARAAYAKAVPNKPLPAKIWSLVEYRELLAGAELEVVQVYGCFPDYKLIRRMIPLEDVNALLANHGLPFPEHAGVNGTTLTTNESLDAVYRLLGKNKIAEYFCPSYGIVARRPA